MEAIMVLIFVLVGGAGILVFLYIAMIVWAGRSSYLEKKKRLNEEPKFKKVLRSEIGIFHDEITDVLYFAYGANFTPRLDVDGRPLTMTKVKMMEEEIKTSSNTSEEA